MDSDVEKLAENVENLQIEKNSLKNWSDLPVQLKEEVIKYLDFKSSLNLRQTARLEQILVDSKKFYFSEVRIRSLHASRSLEFWRPENGSQIFSRLNCMENLAPLSAHILKIGNIHELTIRNECHSFWEELLEKIDSIQVRNLRIHGLLDVDSTVLLLSKCPEILDSVTIAGQSNDDYHTHRRAPEFKLADFAKISNTRVLYCHHGFACFDRNQLSEVVTSFANRQNTVGTIVKLLVATGEMILNFPPTPRSIQNGDRIPTSDPNIEILFKVSDSEYPVTKGVQMHFVPTEPKIDNSDN